MDLGLVDQLGGLDQAIESAAGLAGLDTDGYDVEYLEQELSFAERLLRDIAQTVAPVVAAVGVEQQIPQALSKLLAAASEPIAFIERLNDPRGIYAYCFCDVR
jgi:protease-4